MDEHNKSYGISELDLFDDFILTECEGDDDVSIAEWLEYKENISVNDILAMKEYFLVANPNDESNCHVEMFCNLFGVIIGCGGLQCYYQVKQQQLQNAEYKSLFNKKYGSHFISLYRRIYSNYADSKSDNEICELALNNITISKINNLYFITVIICG